MIVLKKAYRIKSNDEFQRVFRRGQSFANRQLVIYHLEKPEQAHVRVGLSVGKKIGNAVTRNRIKRYLRRAFHELADEVSPDRDIVIIARQPTKDIGFATIKKSVIHLLNREKLLKR